MKRYIENKKNKIIFKSCLSLSKSKVKVLSLQAQLNIKK